MKTNISKAGYFNTTNPHQGMAQAQISKNVENITIGIKQNKTIWLVLTKNNCLNNNLTPSANGCNNPNSVTLLGPKRA
jgi:hypothetical protein